MPGQSTRADIPVTSDPGGFVPLTAVKRHWWWVLGLIVAARWIGKSVKRLFVTPPTPAEARAADKARQKQVRRELRGLE